jgi:hypothetical protein
VVDVAAIEHVVVACCMRIVTLLEGVQEAAGAQVEQTMAALLVVEAGDERSVEELAIEGGKSVKVGGDDGHVVDAGDRAGGHATIPPRWAKRVM